MLVPAPPQNLERLLFLLEPLAYELGEIALTQGERGDSLLFIERGQLGVVVSANFERRPAASYGPGTLVEQALFTFACTRPSGR